MSFRIEEKLFIDKDQFVEFRNFLKKKKVKKIFNPRLIESLYFDNSNFDLYKDSEEGTLPRKKIRIRHYPEDKIKNFYKEIKINSIEGRFKTSTIISESDFIKIKGSGVFDAQYGLCKPTIFVKYFREYYLLMNNIRITIDTNITYKEIKFNKLYGENRVVVELKTDISKDLDELMSEFPIQRIRFSKYCFGINRILNI